LKDRLTITEVAKRHWLRGGKFVMGANHPFKVGAVINQIDSHNMPGVVNVPFKVVGEATVQDALANRPIEWQDKAFSSSYEWWYFIEPCD